MKHLISTRQLNKESTLEILQKAKSLKTDLECSGYLKGKVVANLFYESSTRTRSSFEIAAKKLGADVINIDPKHSALSKGESLEDTAKTLANLGTNLVVIRHSSSGAALELANSLKDTDVSVINAGDGMNEHPTQALLDLFSIHQVYDLIVDKKILILGDCLHSRVARSNIYLLKSFGAKITLVGPPTLVPLDFASMGVEIEHNLHKMFDGTKQIDLIMVLRLQKERQTQGLIPSLSEYRKYYELNEELIKKIDPELKHIKVLHPGPVNRGVEISDFLVDQKDISLIHQQVSNGLYVRMSVLLKLLGNK
ncbi:MAG: aspartate carbamoyltransferase catalytic subunit [Candidatus Caenarcaniphilales bacterium]|nr:aspartate carbamoyltransferase catalytic subunit [Candidatus Caenarcaniphilales bacterium]